MKKSYYGFVLVPLILAGCGGADNVAVPTLGQVEEKVIEVSEDPTKFGLADGDVMEKAEDTEAEVRADGEEGSVLDGITFADLQAGNTVELLDVSGGNASGKAWTTVKDGQTYHRAVGQDLPELEADYFYEGWLVRKPVEGEFFSTGEMTKQPNGEWLLEYVRDGDFLDHAKVVITLEPNDGDPAPAAHIIEN